MRVDRENAAARIGDHHTLDGVFHHGGGQTAALVSLAAGRLIGQQAGNAQQPAIHVPVRLTTGAEPAIQAVAQQPGRQRQYAALFQRLPDLRAHRIRIIRMQTRVEIKIVGQILAL